MEEHRHVNWTDMKFYLYTLKVSCSVHLISFHCQYHLESQVLLLLRLATEDCCQVEDAASDDDTQKLCMTQKRNGGREGAQ